MLYQLPTGKVISLTLDEYLNLSYSDIEWMIASNSGKYSQSPWHGSVLQEGKTKKQLIDKDFINTSDEESESHTISLDTLNIEELDQFTSEDDYLEED